MSNNIPVKAHLEKPLSDFIELYDFRRGTFFEIRSISTGKFIWCDPWWSNKYYISRQKSERQKLNLLINNRGGHKKLRAILVSHTHGDHFADVPEIARQCFGQTVRPKIYCDSNAQSLICHYIGMRPAWQSLYSFYCGMVLFENRELTRRSNPQNPARRRSLGIVHNLEKSDASFVLPSICSKEKWFQIVATRLFFEHSKVNSTFVGKPTPLAPEPSVRDDYCRDDTEETCCPMNSLIGYLFQLYVGSKEAPIFAGRFAIIPGIDLIGPPDNSLNAQLNNLDFFYHIPQAADLVNDWKRNVPESLRPYQVVHTGKSRVHA